MSARVCGGKPETWALMRVAFVNARPFLGAGKLKLMPFGLSAARLLEKSGHQVDLFLAEDETAADYSEEFTEAARLNFLDQSFVWERPGKLNYLLLQFYFRFLVVKQRVNYDLVIGCGQAGNVLGQWLARSIDSPFVLMLDEFLDIHGIPVWEAAEARAAQAADVIVVPDECWFGRLCDKVEGLEGKAWAALPNCPLQDEVVNLPRLDWHERLALPPDSLIFLQAGGLWDFNQIAESMFTVREWAEPAVLLVNGKEGQYNPWSGFSHLDCPGRIFPNHELFGNREFHSLVSESCASFGLYRAQGDLPYVGKSSGKIMRSLACGRPVIASRLFSLDFVEDLGVGIQVEHPREIPAAVETLMDNQDEYVSRCRDVFTKHLSFEVYWERFRAVCQGAGISL